jgi:pseudouridine-5'-phosphate glycosidase
MHDGSLLTIRPDVNAALHPASGRAPQPARPVVALESTVFAHGLPHPQNLETALRLEEAIRQEGALPATIGIIDGSMRVGLTADEIERLATATGVRKVSRRDLPLVVARHENGATTVSATMWIAHRAGIAVCATGGIGGVHRGLPFDVSADLPELAQTPVAVVCSGAKAILDLPLTLEWLETHGVTVLGYRTDRFPAFYSRDSGLPVDARVASPQEAAAVFRAQRRLGLPAGLLIGVPVPPEVEPPPDLTEEAISQALATAEAEGIRGRALTPFLLAQVSQHTAGASLRANIALLENNARVAARIAIALLQA